MSNDFKEKQNLQCAGLVLNSTYNIDSKTAIKFEAEYITKPVKNIFDTTFNSFKNGFAYMVAYIRQF